MPLLPRMARTPVYPYRLTTWLTIARYRYRQIYSRCGCVAEKGWLMQFIALIQGSA